MAKSTRKFVITLFLTSISILIIYTSIKVIREKGRSREENLRSEVIKKLEYFDIIDSNSRNISIDDLDENCPALIFIFSKTFDCQPCNQSILFLNRIKDIMGDRISIYGVVLTEDFQDAFTLADKVKFNIYVPVQLDEFVKYMNVKKDISRTFLYCGGIKYFKLGHLTGKDTAKIINLSKELHGIVFNSDRKR